MPQDFIYLKLTEKATVFVDTTTGLKLVRDVPAKITKKQFESMRNNKNSEFKSRLGSHFQQCTEGEYNQLMDKAISEGYKAKSSKVESVSNDPAEESHVHDENESFDEMTKAELAAYIIENDADEYPGDSADEVKKLKKKSHSTLVEMAEEL
tara:strand:- start:878 stop:1333 length:456 start_codon:yes stop_codon:yes gene_type:complete